jgi:hypothetical protein
VGVGAGVGVGVGVGGASTPVQRTRQRRAGQRIVNNKGGVVQCVYGSRSAVQYLRMQHRPSAV